MTGKEPTKLTLIDTPLGHTDWNMSDNNLLLVAGDTGFNKNMLLASMARQVVNMGGHAFCIDTESKWPAPCPIGAERIGRHQYDPAITALNEAYRAAYMRKMNEKYGSPIVVFMDAFDLMMGHYSTRPEPETLEETKATILKYQLDEIQMSLADVIRVGKTVNVGVVLAGQKIDATNQRLGQRLRAADRVHVNERGEIRIEQGDINLSATIKTAIKPSDEVSDMDFGTLIEVLQRLNRTTKEE